MLIADSKQPCFIAGRVQRGAKTTEKPGLLSAMQVESGLKKGEETFLVSLIEIKPDQHIDVPDCVAKLLKEYADVMPPELPK